MQTRTIIIIVIVIIVLLCVCVCVGGFLAVLLSGGFTTTTSGLGPGVGG